MPRGGSKPGPRPHLWRYKDPVEHLQHRAWLRARAQAKFRREAWEITFEDFTEIWRGQWEQRGRRPKDLCMTRIDTTQPWSVANCEIIDRHTHLKQAGQL